ncbi:hypothetical protein BLNAU_2747 [Blattamonas nauphoetae]|uniref:Uncharacterized protein n=1 Tax=Blattamonas nauphoetae TaxID=2049346 RepID=A0ABQ9YE95_9EUKA|nr:hypothetical protein BLNAU_2747 [Blattamonas nauphoetae]
METQIEIMEPKKQVSLSQLLPNLRQFPKKPVQVKTSPPHQSAVLSPHTPKRTMTEHVLPASSIETPLRNPLLGIRQASDMELALGIGTDADRNIGMDDALFSPPVSDNWIDGEEENDMWKRGVDGREISVDDRNDAPFDDESEEKEEEIDENSVCRVDGLILPPKSETNIGTPINLSIWRDNFAIRKKEWVEELDDQIEREYRPQKTIRIEPLTPTSFRTPISRASPGSSVMSTSHHLFSSSTPFNSASSAHSLSTPFQRPSPSFSSPFASLHPPPSKFASLAQKTISTELSRITTTLTTDLNNFSNWESTLQNDTVTNQTFQKVLGRKWNIRGEFSDPTDPNDSLRESGSIRQDWIDEEGGGEEMQKDDDCEERERRERENGVTVPFFRATGMTGLLKKSEDRKDDDQKREETSVILKDADEVQTHLQTVTDSTFLLAQILSNEIEGKHLVLRVVGMWVDGKTGKAKPVKETIVEGRGGEENEEEDDRFVEELDVLLRLDYSTRHSPERNEFVCVYSPYLLTRPPLRSRRVLLASFFATSPPLNLLQQFFQANHNHPFALPSSESNNMIVFDLIGNQGEDDITLR